MKKILFVINTLSRAGAETALLEFIKRLKGRDAEISLYVLTGLGEMGGDIPDFVKLRNKEMIGVSVLTGEGRIQLTKLILKSLFCRGQIIRQFPYLVSNFASMVKRKNIMPDKLLWRVIAEGADALDEEYDMAVAFLEGGSTYYVADRVKAKKKTAFVHVDYRKAGYTRKLDRDCYEKMDRIYCVSEEVKTSLLFTYPEYKDKTEVFENLLGRGMILEKSLMDGGFDDNFNGTRILTIGRLTKQKAFEVSIEAMKILKDKGVKARWYVLGEGDQRTALENLIGKLGLKDDFILMGKTDNPYPYLKEADLYVHASRFEGKSIAVREAQVLGKPILVSDCEGNREQVTDGVDGRRCEFTPEAVENAIEQMISEPEKCCEYGRKAAERSKISGDEENQIRRFIDAVNS